MDFIKANFGLLVLVIIFTILLGLLTASAFHANINGMPDFVAWLESKAGEVLASIMTVIVGAVTRDRRSSDPQAPAPAPAPAAAPPPLQVPQAH
jgi:hypothetical protein